METQLDDKLSCSICLEVFSDPRNLGCHHTFCFKCITKILKDSKINCPICRVEMKIEEPKLLPRNFVVADVAEFLSKNGVSPNNVIKCGECQSVSVKYCENCQANLCTECLQKHSTFKIFAAHKLSEPSTTSQEFFCKSHEGERLKFWCNNCNKLCCRDCLLLECRKHDYLDAAKAAADSKVELKLKIENTKPHYERKQIRKQELEKIIKDQKEEFKEVTNQIETELEKLELVVRAKKKELKSKLENSSCESLEKLEKDLEETDSDIEGFQIHQSLIEVTKNPLEFLKVKEKIEKFCTNFQRTENPIFLTKFQLTRVMQVVEQTVKEIDVVGSTIIKKERDPLEEIEIGFEAVKAFVDQSSKEEFKFPAAKGKKWTFSWSNDHWFQDNSENLGNKIFFKSFLTVGSGNQWVKASFSTAVLVSSVELRALPGGLLENTSLQYSHDGSVWHHCMVLKNIPSDSTTVRRITPTAARYWRIFREAHGPVGITVLIFE